MVPRPLGIRGENDLSPLARGENDRSALGCRGEELKADRSTSLDWTRSSRLAESSSEFLGDPAAARRFPYESFFGRSELGEVVDSRRLLLLSLIIRNPGVWR